MILGAQILLGFQFQGAFRPRFDALSPSEQAVDAVALVLMLAAVALLIAPSAYHRIATPGHSTGTFGVLTGRLAEAALLPVAVALGLDLALAGNWAFRSLWIGAAVG